MSLQDHHLSLPKGPSSSIPTLGSSVGVERVGVEPPKVKPALGFLLSLKLLTLRNFPSRPLTRLPALGEKLIQDASEFIVNEPLESPTLILVFAVRNPAHTLADCRCKGKRH